MWKLTSKSSLKDIKRHMFNDFGVLLDNDQARDIRSCKHCAVWTPAHYRNCAHDAQITEINIFGVRVRSGAFYSTYEWNSRQYEASKEREKDARGG